MGTRSLTVFKSAWDDGKEIAVMYRQFDGYLNGHGKELAEFLKDIVIVNGITIGDERKLANGMGCLAAQVIAHFKNDVGNIYIHSAGTRHCGEEYIYEISAKNGAPHIKVIDTWKNEPIFEGQPKELLNFIETYEEE